MEAKLPCPDCSSSLVRPGPGCDTCGYTGELVLVAVEVLGLREQNRRTK